MSRASRRWSCRLTDFISDTVMFLSDAERREVFRRLDADRGSLADEYDQKYIWQAFKDWKVWMHMLNFLG